MKHWKNKRLVWVNIAIMLALWAVSYVGFLSFWAFLALLSIALWRALWFQDHYFGPVQSLMRSWARFDRRTRQMRQKYKVWR